jgi:hypothetical protein
MLATVTLRHQLYQALAAVDVCVPGFWGRSKTQPRMKTASSIARDGYALVKCEHAVFNPKA